MEISTEITTNRFTGRKEYTCIARDEADFLIMPTLSSDAVESKARARCEMMARMMSRGDPIGFLELKAHRSAYSN